MKILNKFSKPKAETSPLSAFVNTMKAGDKKRVYSNVIEEATKAQNAILRQAEATRS